MHTMLTSWFPFLLLPILLHPYSGKSPYKPWIYSLRREYLRRDPEHNSLGDMPEELGWNGDSQQQQQEAKGEGSQAQAATEQQQQGGIAEQVDIKTTTDAPAIEEKPTAEPGAPPQPPSTSTSTQASSEAQAASQQPPPVKEETATAIPDQPAVLNGSVLPTTDQSRMMDADRDAAASVNSDYDENLEIVARNAQKTWDELSIDNKVRHRCYPKHPTV